MRMFRMLIGAALVIGAVAAAWSLQPTQTAILIKDVVGRANDLKGHSMVAVTLTIENGAAPDRLIGASSPEGEAFLVGVDDPSGAPVPGNSAPSLAGDGAHIMIHGLQGPLEDGRLLPVTLMFETAGETPVKAALRKTPPREDGVSVGHAMHGSAGVEIGAADAPAVAMTVAPDGDGWRVDVALENFRFAPESIDQPHAPGEGHGHLYIGGLKIMRVTGATARFGALPSGRHRVALELYSNDHRRLLVEGAPVVAAAEIDAP